MIPARWQRPFPAPSLATFVALQTLDILTTVIGMHLGAHEGNYFVSHLMQAGPVAALLIAKIFAALLVAAALRFQKPRVVVFLNYWFVLVVCWNLAVIFWTGFRTIH